MSGRTEGGAPTRCSELSSVPPLAPSIIFDDISPSRGEIGACPSPSLAFLEPMSWLNAAALARAEASALRVALMFSNPCAFFRDVFIAFSAMDAAARYLVRWLLPFTPRPK